VLIETKGFLAERGYDPAYGARPLKRVIQKSIENSLAMKILDGEFGSDDLIKVDWDGKGDELGFEPDGRKVQKLAS